MPDPELPDRRRRTFAPVVLLGLASSALAAVASAKPWLGGTGSSAFETGTKDSVAAAVALVLLASWGVLLVTRGVVRRGFAVLAVLAAIGLLVAVVVGHQTLPGQVHDSFERAIGREASGFTAWFWVAGGSAVLAFVAGVLAVRLVPHWPQMGSRYDAPSAQNTAREPAAEKGTPDTERELWDAIDRGHDPTDTGQ